MVVSIPPPNPPSSVQYIFNSSRTTFNINIPWIRPVAKTRCFMPLQASAMPNRTSITTALWAHGVPPTTLTYLRCYTAWWLTRCLAKDYSDHAADSRYARVWQTDSDLAIFKYYISLPFSRIFSLLALEHDVLWSLQFSVSHCGNKEISTSIRATCDTA